MGMISSVRSGASFFSPVFSYKFAKLATVTSVALAAISGLPKAEAGPGSYWSCVQTCIASMGPGIHSSIICPTVCAPFLMAPGP
jgi:hypothetical protein